MKEVRPPAEVSGSLTVQQGGSRDSPLRPDGAAAELCVHQVCLLTLTAGFL